MRLLTHSCQPISTLFWELGLPPPFGVQSNDQAQRRGRIAKKSISRLFRVRCSALLGITASTSIGLDFDYHACMQRLSDGCRAGESRLHRGISLEVTDESDDE